MSMSFFVTNIVLAAVALVVFQLLPSPLDPVEWKQPNALPEFVGNAAVNTILSKSVVRSYDFSGPECFAANDVGEVYAGVSDGTVVVLGPDGKFISRLIFVGGMMLDKSGDGLGARSAALRETCRKLALTEELAWNTKQERECGRPLGLRFAKEDDERVLYVLDAYWGLFRVNVENAAATKHLVGPDHPIANEILLTSENNNVFDKPLFYNDLDILSDGSIVFTDSSFKFTRSENRPEILDGAGRGRLFLYEKTRDELKVLLCGLHFPNGVQKIRDETVEATRGKEDVIFAELTRFRLIRVNISLVRQYESSFLHDCSEDGYYEAMLTKDGRAEPYGASVFTDSLHGLADNIRIDAYFEGQKDAGAVQDSHSYYYIGFGGKSTKPFSLLWVALQSKWLRVIVGKLVPMRFVEKLIPRYGLVQAVNEKGEIAFSLHDPSGRIALVSVAFRHPLTGDLWLGSHSEHHIAILPHSELPHR